MSGAPICSNFLVPIYPSSQPRKAASRSNPISPLASHLSNMAPLLHLQVPEPEFLGKELSPKLATMPSQALVSFLVLEAFSRLRFPICLEPYFTSLIY